MTRAGAPRLAARERRALGTVLAGVVRADMALYRKLLARLIETNQIDLATLRRADLARDLPAVQRGAHRLKSGGALAGCATVVAAADALEAGARQGDADAVLALLPRCIAIIEDFNRALADLRARA